MKKTTFIAVCALLTFAAISCRKTIPKTLPPQPHVDSSACPSCEKEDSTPVYKNAGSVGATTLPLNLKNGQVIVFFDAPYWVLDSTRIVNCVTGKTSLYDSVRAHAGYPVSGFPRLEAVTPDDVKKYRSVVTWGDLNDGKRILEFQYQQGAMIRMPEQFIGYRKKVRRLNDTTFVIGNNTFTGIDTVHPRSLGMVGSRTQITRQGVLTCVSEYSYGTGQGASTGPVDMAPRLGYDFVWLVEE